MKETHAIMLALPPTEPNGGAIMPLLTGREQIIFPRASALTKATGSRTLAAGAPRHSCGRRTAPKAAATQKKRTKSDSILFAFGGD